MTGADQNEHPDATPPSPTTTEIRIEGANCPFCMNETLAAIRREPGVVDARSSMSTGCLVIDHEHLPVDHLIELVKAHLHGVAFSSNERVMVAVDPTVAELHCTHR